MTDIGSPQLKRVAGAPILTLDWIVVDGRPVYSATVQVHRTGGSRSVPAFSHDADALQTALVAGLWQDERGVLRIREEPEVDR